MALLSHIYKLLTKMITNRFSKKFDKYQPGEQAKFRRDYSAIDRLLTTKILSLQLALVDYKKAFDSIEFGR